MKARIIYKICLLTYKTLKFGELKYLNEYLVPFGLETSVAVRHANDRHRLFEPRTIRSSGERSFQYSAPKLYNKQDRFSVALCAIEERSPKMKNSTQTTLPHFNFSVMAELKDVTSRLIILINEEMNEANWMVRNSAKLDRRTKQHTQFGVSTSDSSRDMERTKSWRKKKKKK